ncbi:hypothetical protein RF11_06615 [Thelohanellus kitauei]|uniref:Uncharacterized protein n=1 Tax=Thelohanellus kitauei TaxID=669202 RepID=A0A0C2INH1_THEKT|nr:hypothetical protein RF11_06615 [Thelohanellus kitauei]
MKSKMYQQSQASKAVHRPYTPKTVTIERKKVYFEGKAKFEISMKQKQHLRFIVIKDIPNSYRYKRIIVPMDNCLKFLIHLEVIRMFEENPCLYTPYERYNDSFCYRTTNTQTEAGREYYFDAMISDDIFELRISYKYGNRFELIHIDLGCVAAFVDIIGTFQSRYPSLTGDDDFDPIFKNEFDIQGGYLTRGSSSNQIAYCPMPVSISSIYLAMNSNVPQNFEEYAEQNNTHALNVCYDPSTFLIKYYAKNLMWETVEVDNSFMGLTGPIWNSEKKYLRIPLKPLKRFQDVEAKMKDQKAKARSDKKKAHES